jgi:CheY-like chemotaxis protein
MTKILVVDDVLSNVRLLKAKLTAEYFEVATALMASNA